MKKKTYKLDIFAVLQKISNGNMKYFDSLNVEEQKGFVPRVVFQWLTGTSDKAQIVAIDDVNYLIDPLYKHPKLLYLLFCIFVTTISDIKAKTMKYKRPNNGRYKWVKTASNKEDREVIKLIQREYGYSKKDAIEVRDLFTNKQILLLAKNYGYQKSEITKIKKELK